MRTTARHFEPSTQQTISPAPPEADVASRMPIIRLKPHKARVVIEDGAEMNLVLKVSLNRGETVELASGGKMEALNGMLRIRERGGLLTRADGRIAGKLTYVPETAAESVVSILLELLQAQFQPLDDTAALDREDRVVLVARPVAMWT